MYKNGCFFRICRLFSSIVNGCRFPYFKRHSATEKREIARNLCHLFALFQRKEWDMKSRYRSLRKNPAGSPENKKISYPGKGTRFGKHLFITYVKIEYTLCVTPRSKKSHTLSSKVTKLWVAKRSIMPQG